MKWASICASALLFVAGTQADYMTTTPGPVTCDVPLGLSSKRVKELCAADPGYDCTKSQLGGPVCSNQDSMHKVMLGEDAVACGSGASKAKDTISVQLAIANGLIGDKDGGRDCSAWCLYDYVKGPTQRHWRWDNGNQCWRKKSGRFCKDASDGELANAIDAWNNICKLGDGTTSPWVRAKPTCSFTRLAVRPRDTTKLCWRRTSQIPTGMRPHPVPDTMGIANWGTRSTNEGLLKARELFEELLIEDPNAFAYSVSADGNKFKAWTTDVAHPIYDMPKGTGISPSGYAYDSPTWLTPFRFDSYHGSASSICEWDDDSQASTYDATYVLTTGEACI
eukprot:m.268719 g.268719  ORF g.268719 m.268719 type:complete len:336 (-) comp80079_c0_seq1:197-1204(-)